jgi:hypothetical protein
MSTNGGFSAMLRNEGMPILLRERACETTAQPPPSRGNLIFHFALQRPTHISNELPAVLHEQLAAEDTAEPRTDPDAEVHELESPLNPRDGG